MSSRSKTSTKKRVVKKKSPDETKEVAETSKEVVVKPPPSKTKKSKTVVKQEQKEDIVPVVIEEVIKIDEPIVIIEEKEENKEEIKDEIKEENKVKAIKKVNKKQKVEEQPTLCSFGSINSFSSFTPAKVDSPQKIKEPQEPKKDDEKKEEKREEERDSVIPANTIKVQNEKINNVDFFLYYDLYNKTEDFKNEKLTDKDHDQLMKNMKQIDIEGVKMLYLLLRMYSIKNNCGKIFDLPFEGKVIKEYNNLFDIEFDLKLLPVHLQHILLAFTNKHLEIINDSSTRYVAQNIRPF